MTTHKAYFGYDNTSKFLLKANNATYASLDTKTTDVHIRFNNYTYRATSASWTTSPGGDFDWSSSGASGILCLKLGKIIDDVDRDRKTELILFDASNVSGIVWSQFDLKVVNIKDPV